MDYVQMLIILPMEEMAERVLNLRTVTKPKIYKLRQIIVHMTRILKV